jgi:hypothetical protein
VGEKFKEIIQNRKLSFVPELWLMVVVVVVDRVSATFAKYDTNTTT